MNAKKLKPNDKVAIISLSSGVLGEPFASHELELGVKRLKEFGLVPIIMPNSLKGMEYLKNHPEARADDLKTAFADSEIKAIICAIGGNDTYKTFPYLLNDETFISNVKNHPKIFIGFSDTTANHIMFHYLGLDTFYGPALLTDFAEFEKDMLPYTKNAINYLFNPTKEYEIKSSPIWYEDRKDFSVSAVGTLRVSHNESKGYEVLQGSNVVSGKLLGGCIEVLNQLLPDENSSNEEKEILTKFNIFPSLNDWKNKIMFIETSEEKIKPENYRRIIQKFKNLGIFNQINGLLVGKPIDEIYYEEYKQILKEELAEFDFPIIYNLNFGHAYPRMVLPYGAICEINPSKKSIKLISTTLE